VGRQPALPSRDARLLFRELMCPASFVGGSSAHARDLPLLRSIHARETAFLFLRHIDPRLFPVSRRLCWAYLSFYDDVAMSLADGRANSTCLLALILEAFSAWRQENQSPAKRPLPEQLVT
jgi:hypothetical protein